METKILEKKFKMALMQTNKIEKISATKESSRIIKEKLSQNKSKKRKKIMVRTQY